MEKNLDTFIKKFLGGVRFVTLENEGLNKEVTVGPRVEPERQRETMKPERKIVNPVEGEEIESI